jgi:hypothetical protein
MIIMDDTSRYENNSPVGSVPEQNQSPEMSASAPVAQDETNPAEQNSMPSTTGFSPGFITWTAAEYAESDRSHRWFAVLIVGAAILTGLVLFFMHDLVLAVMIVAMTTTVIVITRRPPREISYSLSYEAFTVDQKAFPISSFRAFGLVQEGAVWNIRLISNKRFIPPVTAYIPNDMGEQIVDALGALLPMEDIEPDFVDKLVAKSKI